MREQAVVPLKEWESQEEIIKSLQAENEKLKHYCKDCKHCKYREFPALGVNWGWFCKLKDRVSVNSVGHKTIDFSYGNCEELNQDYACLDYKRKWWKFWRAK